MKRLALLPITAVDGNRVPTVPITATGWCMLHDFGPRALVKLNIPDGTAKTATTIADVTMEAPEDGRQRQVDINVEALTSTQRTTIKTMLQANGFDVSQFDGDNLADRAKLLRFVLRRLAGWQDMPVRELLDGWDAS